MCCVKGGVRGGCPFGWEALPVALAAVFWLGFISTYIIAVALDHVHPVLPMISGTGMFLPERGLFTLILFTSALLHFALSVLVYKLNALLYADPPRAVRVTNKVNVAISTFISVGLVLAGSFQESRCRTANVLHLIGSAIAFGSTAVSIVLQAVISLHARRALGRRGIVAMVQAAMAVISWGLIFAYLALLVTFVPHLPAPWRHTTAAIMEWVLTYFIVLFPLTYHNELRRWTTGSPGGAGQEQERLLEAEQLLTRQNQYS